MGISSIGISQDDFGMERTQRVVGHSLNDRTRMRSQGVLEIRNPGLFRLNSPSISIRWNGRAQKLNQILHQSASGAGSEIQTCEQNRRGKDADICLIWVRCGKGRSYAGYTCYPTG
jgi:hypothetical protein